MSWLDQPPAASTLSWLGELLCCIYDDGTACVFVTASTEGEVCRNEFDPEQKEIDSFCLSEQGVPVSFASEDNLRHCVLLCQNGTRTEKLLVGMPLYRLESNDHFALCVDSGFGLYSVRYLDGQIVLSSQFGGDPLPGEQAGALSIFAAGEEQMVIYFDDSRQFFTLALEPAEA